jgi:hypothetical protein
VALALCPRDVVHEGSLRRPARSRPELIDALGILASPEAMLAPDSEYDRATGTEAQAGQRAMGRAFKGRSNGPICGAREQSVPGGAQPDLPPVLLLPPRDANQTRSSSAEHFVMISVRCTNEPAHYRPGSRRTPSAPESGRAGIRARYNKTGRPAV